MFQILVTWGLMNLLGGRSVARCDVRRIFVPNHGAFILILRPALFFDVLPTTTLIPSYSITSDFSISSSHILNLNGREICRVSRGSLFPIYATA